MGRAIDRASRQGAVSSDQQAQFLQVQGLQLQPRFAAKGVTEIMVILLLSNSGQKGY